MFDLLEHTDHLRRDILNQTARSHKSELGQFMTPASIAKFMASLFPSSKLTTCKLLDAGAGIGSLSCAFLDRWSSGNFGFQKVEVHAYEIDDTLCDHLKNVLANYETKLNIQPHIFLGDFIELATNLCVHGQRKFTHAILNPPYKKINSASQHRLSLRGIGIETVNLYSAFISLALALMAPGGYLVAIVPRSFCNGPYYKSFRKFILNHAAIKHIHLFKSRTNMFKDEQILQENIIIVLEKDAHQKNVTITHSTDATFTDLVAYEHPFSHIIFQDNPDFFIHIPTSIEEGFDFTLKIQCSLEEIGVKVSTGPIVDFRTREHIRHMPELGTVPLLYSNHFVDSHLDWPKFNIKKCNAIFQNAQTEKWLYPSGFYCIVRRLSSKEEKRRIMASVVEPKIFPKATAIGFENHLNVFHEHKKSLPEFLARGLAIFLNTSLVDKQFRQFNGHTQVNATDLRLMKYPSRKILIALGKWALNQRMPTQAMIDEQLMNLIL